LSSGSITGVAAVVDVDVVREAERLRGTLSPLRRRLLEELREPGSATGLATRLGESRQRLNYHLRELEQAGLVELVEERQRRGRVERVVRATARSVVLAPQVLGELPAGNDPQDRFAVGVLLAAAARTLDDVSRMRESAARTGKRLITFAIEADVAFARPKDIERFAGRLADAVADLAAEFGSPTASNRYRIVVGGHPAPADATEPSQTEKDR
jgi:DNA-binding transcriptional ArsR family regulator